MQMRGGGTSQLLYKGGIAGRPAAGRPVGAGRPVTGRPAPGTCLQFFHLFFTDKPLPPGCRAARSRPPGSGAAGVYFCKFPNRKYIFVKNGNKKYKNKKTAVAAMVMGPLPPAAGSGGRPSIFCRHERAVGASGRAAHGHAGPPLPRGLATCSNACARCVESQGCTLFFLPLATYGNSMEVRTELNLFPIIKELNPFRANMRLKEQNTCTRPQQYCSRWPSKNVNLIYMANFN